MEELLDLIASDSSATNVSDKIKELIFNKTSEKIDELRPSIASELFGGDEESVEEE
jgi:hypothetical protein